MNKITAWLERAHPAFLIGLGGAAAFCTYFSMYAFRKPFSAATFDTVEGWDFQLDFKIALVIAQVIGYAISKFIGIKIISELGKEKRGLAILGLIGLSWIALVLFAILPAPWNVAALFLNGLPLGLIWGLVFNYLEGRRSTEALGAILCVSFIVSSGAVKSLGALIMAQFAVSPFWMPAVTGFVFFPLLFISVWGLSLLPDPSAQDIAARVKRVPMNSAQRRSFMSTYGLGLVLLIAGYVFLTAFRDFRDNFAAEIWRDLGQSNGAALFTLSELPVALVALTVLASFMGIKNNRTALLVVHGLVGLGFAIIGLSTLAFEAGLIGPVAWMIIVGAGLYSAYTPFNTVLFDRLVAATGQLATAGFLIYLADASGYLGSVALLLAKNFATLNLDWVAFFKLISYIVSVVGTLGMFGSALYFRQRLLVTEAPINKIKANA
jgi:Family of unknown function (DUF5690)